MTPDPAPKPVRPMPVVLIVALLVVGALGSVFAGLAWRSSVAADQRHTFETTATADAGALTTSLQRDADIVATARTLIATNPQMTNKQFSTWFDSLDAVHRYPGAFAFAFIQSVTPAQLPQFQAAVAADPPEGIAPAGGFHLSPPGDRSHYCLMRFTSINFPKGTGAIDLNSFEKLEGTFATYLDPGVDECQGSQAPLFTQSAQTGSLTVGSFGGLIQSAVAQHPDTRALVTRVLGNLSPIELMEPVYSSPTLGTAPRLLGWVGGIFDSNDLLSPISNVQSGTSLVLATRQANGSLTVLSRVGHPAPGAMTSTYRLDAEGHWVLVLTGENRANKMSADLQGAVVMLVGLILIALFFLLIRVLTNSRSAALALVEEKTGELRHLALHDSLTGLPNRTLIMERTTEALERAKATGEGIAILFIDLDGFKDINDANGHGVGDFLLHTVAERFAGVLRSTDTVGRLGGDEFVVLAEGRSAGRPELLAERLLATCVDPIHVANHPGALPVAASIGIATGIRDTAEELLRDADIALYQAKAAGKGRYVVFEQDMHTAVRNRITLESDLREALVSDQFWLAYQPLFDLVTLRIIGVEALMRWTHPTRGPLPPMEFIPTLEESGLIVEAGRWVLDEACRQAAEWEQDGLEVQMSVNVSARQLEVDRVVDDVGHALMTSGLAARNLVLEITETGLMRDAGAAARRLIELKALGVQVAIDDFGTGYSSLAYLQQFPADVIKVDGSFISDMTESTEGTALVHAMLQLAKALGLETLAEGIERPEQLQLLRDEGCDFGQGYLFARPLTPQELRPLLVAGGVPDPTAADRPGPTGGSGTGTSPGSEAESTVLG